MYFLILLFLYLIYNWFIDVFVNEIIKSQINKLHIYPLLIYCIKWLIVLYLSICNPIKMRIRYFIKIIYCSYSTETKPCRNRKIFRCFMMILLEPKTRNSRFKMEAKVACAQPAVILTCGFPMGCQPLPEWGLLTRMRTRKRTPITPKVDNWHFSSYYYYWLGVFLYYWQIIK